MIFWLSRCPQCGSVFREHQCAGKGTMSAATYNATYTQLAMFEEERDED